MTLQKFIDSLSKDRQINLAIRLTKLTLSIWDKYADNHALTYRDTVVGLTHSVSRQLLAKTIDTIIEDKQLNNSFHKLGDLKKNFEDPIVALRDLDWELPDEVQKTFYSVHNLLDAYLGKDRTTFDELTIYVAINQAVDALMTSKTMTVEDITKILEDTKNGS